MEDLTEEGILAYFDSVPSDSELSGLESGDEDEDFSRENEPARVNRTHVIEQHNDQVMHLLFHGNPPRQLCIEEVRVNEPELFEQNDAADETPPRPPDLEGSIHELEDVQNNDENDGNSPELVEQTDNADGTSPRPPDVDGSVHELENIVQNNDENDCDLPELVDQNYVVNDNPPVPPHVEVSVNASETFDSQHHVESHPPTEIGPNIDQPTTSRSTSVYESNRHRDHNYTVSGRSHNKRGRKVVTLGSPRKTRSKRRNISRKLKEVTNSSKVSSATNVRDEPWYAGKDNDFNGVPPAFVGNPEINVVGDTPFEFFSCLFPEHLYDLIAFESKRYAFQNKKTNFKVTVQDLKLFIGINIIMTYIKYPQSRMYWSSIQGLRLDVIANSMSVNRFDEIKRFIHFVNNEDKENVKEDKFWKIRPIADVLMSTFKDAVTGKEHQSIDEMMVPFKGRHHLKQFLKNKPKRWGFKIWVRASSCGYVYSFELYEGGKAGRERSAFGPIGDVVLRLCEDLHNKNHKIYMDNLFTSLPLIRKLKELGIFVVGTLRTNRVPKCVIEKLVDPKLMSRGNSSVVTSTDNITIVRWIDNSPVHTISSYAGALPEDSVTRYDKSRKERVTVTRPYSVQQYNMFMGGVDLMDRMIAHYAHGFKNKRWYLRVFFHFINMTLVNAWLLYKTKIDPNCSLLAFKASVATSLINIGVATSKRVGRPSSDNQEPLAKKKRTAPPKMPYEIRFDGVDHYPKKVATSQAPRCHSRNCKSRTRYVCQKCQEPVCPDCMADFHKK